MPVFCTFLEIGSLDFPESWHGARDSYKVVHDRARVFGKNSKRALEEKSKLAEVMAEAEFFQKQQIGESQAEQLRI